MGRGLFTVGWYDDSIRDWYFGGEYGTREAAVACARKTATNKACKTRITDQETEQVEYFDPA